MTQLDLISNRAKNSSSGSKKLFYAFRKNCKFTARRTSKRTKFKRTCNNPFHKDWPKTDGGGGVNVKASGLTAVANNLERYVQAELGKKGWHTINSLCMLQSLHF